MQWGSQGRLLNTEKTHSDFLITSLAYVTHHKHAYSSSTNREIERMGEKEQRIFFCGTKWCTKIKVCVSFCFKNKKKKPKTKLKTKQNQPPEDINRTDYTQERKGKILHDSKRLPSVYRTERERERQTQRAKNIRRLHSSHIKGAFFMEYFPGSFIHSNGS